MLLARWARAIGDRLASALDLTPEAADRAAYASEVLLLDLLTLGAIALASLLTGVFWPAAVSTITAALLRSTSGGAHSNSPWRCIALSAVVAVLCGMLGRLTAPYAFFPRTAILAAAVGGAGMAIAARFAPAETVAKPLSPRQRIVLKRLTLALLSLWTAGLIFLPVRGDLLIASIAGMVWQLFSLTPAGFSFLGWVDNFREEVTSSA